MIGIVDYGVGNLFSLSSSLSFIGAESTVSSDPCVLKSCDRIILPGVGAFGDAIAKLRGSALDRTVCEIAARGTPVLGICLGMQLLFERSYEYGEHTGLSLLSGSVVPMKGAIPENLRIPHIGWNALHFIDTHPLFRYVREGEEVYFVHSYYATDCEDSLLATAEYGAPLTAAVARGNVMGCQFHPEKSGDVGMRILRAFAEGVDA